jgi:hypothetical protein
MYYQFKISDVIEELVETRGNINFDDLSYKEQKNMVLYALESPSFDDYETYLEGINIPEIIRMHLNNDKKSNLKEEIESKLITYFEPMISKMMEDRYQKSFEDQEIPQKYLHIPF